MGTTLSTTPPGWSAPPCPVGCGRRDQVGWRGVPRGAIRAWGPGRLPPLVQIAHHTRALGDRQAWLQQAHAASEQAIALGDEGIAAGILREMLAEPTLDSHLRSRAALTLS